MTSGDRELLLAGICGVWERNGGGDGGSRRSRRRRRPGSGMSDSLFQLVPEGQTVRGCVHVMASH